MLASRSRRLAPAAAIPLACLLLVAADARGLTNLVPNGDFEGGNTGFLSDYGFANPNGDESQYFVGSNPQAWNSALVSAPDHTEVGTLMFLGNGAQEEARVWYSSAPIPVMPATDYFFEAWVMNLCCRPGTPFGNGVDPAEPAVLSFFANGELLGTRSSALLGVWEPLSTTWSSGSATSVLLELVNANPAVIGNDFAVDDVFLGTESSVPEPSLLAIVFVALLAVMGLPNRERSAACARKAG